ncbi:MAG: HAMP domain-containing histidine kinase [Bernardetiaceae bacterium]|nr:HAMP domain-containing histidine kinase [Bernardetiaceae bacterium]
MKWQNVYLPGALVSLVLTIFFSYPMIHLGTSGQVLFHEQVKANLARELATAKGSLEALKARFEKAEQIKFGDLPLDTRYPLFVFKGNDLLLWTSNRHTLKREDLNGKFKEVCIQNPNGIYLIYKDFVRVDDSTRYQFAALVPVYVRYRVSNDNLRATFNPDIFPETEGIRISREDSVGMAVRNPGDGRYLFSVVLPKTFNYTGGFSRENAVLVFTIFTICFSFLQIRANLLEYLAAGRTRQALALLVISLFCLRFLLKLIDVPSGLSRRFELFSSKLFASSEISPSLGDLFFNILVFFLLTGFLYLYYHQLFKPRQVLALGPKAKFLLAGGLAAANFGAFYFTFSVLRSTYFNSAIRLDISADLDYNVFKIIALLNFVQSAFIYFFASHVTSRLLLLIYNRQARFYLALGTGLALAILPLLGSPQFPWGIVALHIGYVLLISLLRLPRRVRQFQYATYIYLLLSAIVSALLGAYATYNFESNINLANKKRFANDVVADNDTKGEFLLSQALSEIAQDQTILNKMLNSSAYLGSSVDMVVNKIKRQHLDNYFNRYETTVLLFNAQGQPYNATDSTTYQTYEERYADSVYRTDYPGIKFVNDQTGGPLRYLGLLPLERNGRLLGRVVLDLRLKKISPNSIYSSLLSEDDQVNDPAFDGMSYAIFEKDRLVYSAGPFGYDPDFVKLFDGPNPPSEDRQVVVGGSRHLLLAKSNQRRVIISSPVYPARNLVSNFSFLFLLLFISKLVMATLYLLRLRKLQLRFNFSARIQLYLNLAFFLPLLIVSVMITSILNSVDRDENKQQYLKKAETISTNPDVLQGLDTVRQALSGTTLEENLDRISSLAQVEINLYGRDGRLRYSTLKDFIDKGVLTNLVNPQAYAEIIEKNHQKEMLTEAVGSLNYNSVYVAVRLPESSEVHSIIGIPFFDSQRNTERQIISVLGTILNVVTFIFIGLLGLSYLASRILTEPLRMLTQKIGRLTLSQKNEPIGYQAEDEIGLVVNAYNKMLVQLEASKQALARSEKESAWREMAQQVAHEIKNPLTPMKLTLQHLQRVLGNENPRLSKSVDGLLNQIEILSDIATSFSAFAKMPIPKNEDFEIGDTLRQTVLLYANDEKAKVGLEAGPGQFWVNGDQALMGRIFTNLIINGIQAVPNDRQPIIWAKLHRSPPDKVLIQITDNGTGIPENIRQKVFLPNFSTKFTGSGIGLALAKRGIEHAGGRIWFETEDDQGTSFFIELPLLSPAPVPDGQVKESAVA